MIRSRTKRQLDAAKSALITAVFVHHGVITFCPKAGIVVGEYYFIPEEYQIPQGFAFAGMWFCDLQRSYFMSLFFFISAYLTPSSFDRKGFFLFMEDRITRLGIPLVVSYFALNPSLYILVHKVIYGLPGSVGTMYAKGASPGVCWFLQFLLIFNLLYAACATITRKYQPVIAPLPHLHWLLFAGCILGLVTYSWSFLSKNGAVLWIGPYTVFFVSGVLAKRGDWLSQLQDWSAFQKSLTCTIAVVSCLAILCYQIYPPERLQGGVAVLGVFYSFWFGIAGVSMSFAGLIICQSYLNFTSPFTYFASSVAYSVYIIHMWVITPLAWSFSAILAASGFGISGGQAVAPLSPHSLLIAGAIYTITFGLPISGGIGWCLRRIPGVRQIL